MTSADLELAHVASEHHGIVTRSQALGAGLSSHALDHRLRSGRWVMLHPGVYRVSGAPRTWRGDLLAVCFAAPGPGVASHRSAAALWRLPGGSEQHLEITCDRWQRAQSPGLIVHETGVLSAEDVTERDAIPCMTVERTLLSLGAVASASTVEIAVDTALRRGLTTIEALGAIVRRLGKRGRNGVGVLRRLVVLHDREASMTESEMETRLKQLLRRAGLPTPIVQYEIRHFGQFVARVDAAYPDLSLALEYDSYEHHTGRAALVRDSHRRNALVGIGWSTISVTAVDIYSGGDAVIGAIQAARARSGVTEPR
jgi:very-short-patch-repair endonuclease